jgi:hypothetical protein
LGGNGTYEDQRDDDYTQACQILATTPLVGRIKTKYSRTSIISTNWDRVEIIEIKTMEN